MIVRTVKQSSVVFRVNRLNVNLADLYRQVTVNCACAETGEVQICTAPLAGERANQKNPKTVELLFVLEHLE